MRKSISFLAALAALLAASSKPAHAFFLQAQATVAPLQVTGQVYNHFPQPIFCSIRVQGLRSDGLPLWGYANTAILPGTTGYALVFTGFPFQFVNGQAFADCRFNAYSPFSEESPEADLE